MFPTAMPVCLPGFTAPLLCLAACFVSAALTAGQACCFILVDSEEERGGAHFTGVAVHCTTEAPEVLPHSVGPLWNPKFIPAPIYLGEAQVQESAALQMGLVMARPLPFTAPQVCSDHHSITGGGFNPGGRGRGVPIPDRAPVWRAARAGETEGKDLTPSQEGPGQEEGRVNMDT